MSELFIGLTTWNDAEFIRHSVPALQRTLVGIDVRVAAWDNGSIDDTPALLRDLGVEVTVRRCAQADALHGLLAMSNAPYTLLLHSDVFLLYPAWFPLLREALHASGAVLISPNDIGLGAFRRQCYTGNPESPFMFFDTEKARRCTSRRPWSALLKNAVRFRYLQGLHGLPFDAPHITHGLSAAFHTRGYTWEMMRPLPSPRCVPWFTVDDDFRELSSYTYGDGNFYAYHGVITHYHNWLARYIGRHGQSSADYDDRTRQYNTAYTQRFLTDLQRGAVQTPEIPE